MPPPPAAKSPLHNIADRAAGREWCRPHRPGQSKTSATNRTNRSSRSRSRTSPSRTSGTSRSRGASVSSASELAKINPYRAGRSCAGASRAGVLMRANAHVVAESDGRGGTRLAVLRGEPPLLMRRTGALATGPRVTVHLVAGAAGPLRGDKLRLDVEVGPGAWLDVRSVAASLALPGNTAQPPSRLEIRAAVAADAVLRWLPEPLIAAAGCDHRAVSDVRIDAGGSLTWRDDLVCGRHGEPAGDVRIDTTIRYAGRTLYRHELAVGPAAPGWSGPAVLGATAAATGAGRAVGSVILAGPGLPPAGMLGEEAVLMPLAGPGMLAMAVGDDIRQVRAALDPLSAFTVITSTTEQPSTPATATP
jgi:urease accessory protein